MPDPDQPRRRPAGVACPPPAVGLPCGKIPRGPTAVARGCRRCRHPRSRAGGPATRRRRLAHRRCRTRDLRLRGHRIRQTHLKRAAIAGHSRDLPDPRELRSYARKGPHRRRPRRDADFRTPAQAAARCGRGWGGVAAVLAWVPPVSPLGKYPANYSSRTSNKFTLLTKNKKMKFGLVSRTWRTCKCIEN